MSNRAGQHEIHRRKLLRLAAGGAVTAAFGHRRFMTPLEAAETHLTLPLGMNLAGISDWAIGYPFLNLMWGSRIWFTQQLSGGAWDTQLVDTIDFDPDGYPLEMPFHSGRGTPAQCVVTLLPNVLSAGRYVILFNGEGVIGSVGSTRIVDVQPGRIEISMRHDRENVEGLSIRRSTRGNHIRNIRVLPLESEHANLDQNPYRQEVIAFCRPWHCLRFMDWLGTNNSINREWTKRKQRNFYTQMGANGDILNLTDAPLPAWQRKWASGIAIELCLDLANLVNRDAWLCVPHLADDDHIVQMAKLVKERLNPSLKVFLEFSNEIWNQQFLQAQWLQSRDFAEAAGGAARGAEEGIDFSARIGALFQRCFKLWEEIFVGGDRKRLVRVCSVQADGAETAKHTLAWLMAHGGCDALAPAGYFGADELVYARWEAAGERLSADQVIDDMRSMIAKNAEQVRAIANLARQAGVRFITYEGGQHIQPLGQAEKPYNAALGTAQKHPLMYDLTRDNQDLFARAGCDLFCVFNSIGLQGARWGSWGHAESYNQDPADMPKYRAILDANSSLPDR